MEKSCVRCASSSACCQLGERISCPACSLRVRSSESHAAAAAVSWPNMPIAFWQSVYSKPMPSSCEMVARSGPPGVFGSLAERSLSSSDAMLEARSRRTCLASVLRACAAWAWPFAKRAAEAASTCMFSSSATWPCSPSVVWAPMSGTGVVADAMMLGKRPLCSTRRIAGACCSRPRKALSARVCRRPKRKLACSAVGCVVVSSPDLRLGRKISKLDITSGDSVKLASGSGASSIGSSLRTEHLSSRRSVACESSRTDTSESSAPSHLTRMPCSTVSRVADCSGITVTWQPM
mmetsp:Transcript_4087/g.13221  ORF Transcript_4087/g.13221 Transcript_4087/m.13221 type:complete len:292 (-) Transcript_4087:1066-1941(-)